MGERSPRGKYKLPVIQYMLIDAQFEYLVYPQELEVTNLKKKIQQIVLHIEQASVATPLEIYYKSIIEALVSIDEIQQDSTH